MKCSYCNKETEYIDSKNYYSNGVSYGMIYICRGCDAYVGVHKGTDNALGTLANKELRELRKQAHALFDPIWKSGKMSRKDAYRYLFDNTGVKHISWTDIESCKKVIEFLDA